MQESNKNGYDKRNNWEHSKKPTITIIVIRTTEFKNQIEIGWTSMCWLKTVQLPIIIT